MTPQQIKDKVYQQIKIKLAERKKNRIEPVIVLSVPLFNSLKLTRDEYQKAIRELIREKKIVYGETINDFYYKLKK